MMQDKVFKVEVGVQVMHLGVIYTVTNIVSTTDVIARRDDTGEVKILEVHTIDPVEKVETHDISENKYDLALYSEKEWQEAEKRFNIIRPLLSLPHRTAADVKAVANQKSVHPATIYSWISHYVSSGGEITSLVPERSGRKRGTKLISKEIEIIIGKTIEDFYLTTQKLRPKDVCDEVIRRCKSAGIKEPHPNTVRNRIKQLPHAVVLKRRGRKDLARNLYAPIIGAFPGAEYPFSVVQIDHTQCDIVLVDDIYRKAIGRPWLTLAIDVYSRMIAGYYLSFDAPNATATGICLARAILPKEGLLATLNVAGKWPVYGFMKVVHADNAKEFRGSMLKRACQNYNIERLWQREGLKVPSKQPKRKRLWLNEYSCMRLSAQHQDHVWSYDFVHHRTEDGKAFRTLNIVDEYTRECLMIKVQRKLNSMDVINALGDLFILTGIPQYIRSDNGPELIAKELRDWIEAAGAQCAFIEPGSPWKNGYVESFNARLRDELLNGEIFYTLKEAQILIDQWRIHYNTIRPHSALGYKAPASEALINNTQENLHPIITIH